MNVGGVGFIPTSLPWSKAGEIDLLSGVYPISPLEALDLVLGCAMSFLYVQRVSSVRQPWSTKIVCQYFCPPNGVIPDFGPVSRARTANNIVVP